MGIPRSRNEELDWIRGAGIVIGAVATISERVRSGWRVGFRLSWEQWPRSEGSSKGCLAISKQGQGGGRKWTATTRAMD